MTNNEFEIALVRFRQCAKLNVTFRKIDALVTTKPAARFFRVRNPDAKFVIRYEINDALYLAVIQVNRVLTYKLFFVLLKDPDQDVCRRYAPAL